MLEKGNIITELLRRLDQLPIGECLDLRSYKRDRSILFIKLSDDNIRIIEDGFEQSDAVVAREQWKKELRERVKREFPRSNKLRLYNLGPFDEQQHEQQQRKRI